MKIKLTLIAAVLALSPGLALAQGCMHGKPAQEASISCAEGSVYNATTGTCETTSS